MAAFSRQSMMNMKWRFNETKNNNKKRGIVIHKRFKETIKGISISNESSNKNGVGTAYDIYEDFLLYAKSIKLHHLSQRYHD